MTIRPPQTVEKQDSSPSPEQLAAFEEFKASVIAGYFHPRIYPLSAPDVASAPIFPLFPQRVTPPSRQDSPSEFGNQDDAEAKEIEKIIEALPYPHCGEIKSIGLWYKKVDECLREGRVNRARSIAEAAPFPALRSHLLHDIARYLQEHDKPTCAMDIAYEMPDLLIRRATLRSLLSDSEKSDSADNMTRVIEAELFQPIPKKRNFPDDPNRRQRTKN